VLQRRDLTDAVAVGDDQREWLYLHPEWREHYERLRQEIDRLLDDPSTRPNLEQ
jgi:hypothetical protein